MIFRHPPVSRHVRASLRAVMPLPPRYRTLIPSLFLFVCLAVLLVKNRHLDGQSYPIRRLRGAFGVPDPAQVRLFRMAELELQSSSRENLEQPNLLDMGSRTAKLTSMIEAAVAEPRLDTLPLLSVLAQEYPWFNPVEPVYAPWAPSASNQSSQKTGIVMCVGSGTFTYAAHLIVTLRRTLGSRLPIEVFHAGDDDLAPDKRHYLAALGSDVTLVDLRTMFDGAQAGIADAGFGMKPFAMVASRFQQVILVDADVIFLRKPDDIFEEEAALRETGTFFWHDRATMITSRKPMRPWLKEVLQDRKPSEMLERSLVWQADILQEMESGVVCMDKSRPSVFTSLLFTTWMNTKPVRKTIEDYLWGDKETYWLAAELSGAPYHFEPEYGGTIGSLEPNREDTILGTHIAHGDSSNRLFWFNGSIRENKDNPSNELLNMTHWMNGAIDYPGSPEWSILEDGRRWRLQGSPVPLADTPYEMTIERLKYDVESLDGQLEHAFDK